MKFRKAIVDFLSLLPAIILALSLIISSYLAYGQIAEALKKMIEENAKQIVVVTPQGGKCMVSVIKQT